ncbi:MAG: hypothetical protein KZQ65_08175 [Candidatus Thiodiazotropha sp. (ex Gloverina cf. vestifex)]|nr:hypothetical protein [Candidatus Thiodiazotropha sp. (ex Gloverina cf. vestifex)]
MNIDNYDVYFSGACLKKADPAEVKRKIGAMFKLEGEKLERLFSGKPVPIKRGVDMDQAVKFRVAFRDAGALVDIVPEGQPAPTPSPAPTTRPAAPTPATDRTESAPSTSSGLTLAEGPLPPDSEAEKITPVPVPDYDLSAPQDFNLSDCAPQVEPVPIPDTSAMDLDKPGAALDETPDPEPLEIDTEALTLDDPGTTLIEETPFETPEIDTDDLSMSEPQAGSLEDCQIPVEPAPLPNIDHLQLDEAATKKKPQGKAKFEIAED